MPRQRHDSSKNMVSFLVGETTYAVRIDLVREIVRPLEIAELPLAPKSVRGVASFREHVVPVVDLRDRFGLPPIQDSRRSKWIIVDVARVPIVPLASAAPVASATRTEAEGRSLAALAVDSVTEVFGIANAAVRPSPSLGDGDAVRGIEGVTEHGGKLVFVLDLRSLQAIVEASAAAGHRLQST
ncbi:MAG: chemotaxis protein CheW [Polyangiaceae bacterium]|nr:chemotaxis protein CheW [Polyangiaceae bacterium]